MTKSKNPPKTVSIPSPPPPSEYEVYFLVRQDPVTGKIYYGCGSSQFTMKVEWAKAYGTTKGPKATITHEKRRDERIIEAIQDPSKKRYVYVPLNFPPTGYRYYIVKVKKTVNVDWANAAEF